MTAALGGGYALVFALVIRAAPGRALAGTLVTIAGASGATARENTRQAVADDYVPVGARSFKVASARGFRAGDAVIVRRLGNQEWIDAIGMNGD